MFFVFDILPAVDIFAVVGKLFAYCLFFAIAAYLLKLGNMSRALNAGIYRFGQGLLSIIPIALLRMILPSESVVTDVIATATIWSVRCLTWWLSYRIAFPAPRVIVRKQIILIVAGLLLNVALDMIVFGFPPSEGRGRMSPSFGYWDFSL